MIKISSEVISGLIATLVAVFPLFFIYGMWADDLGVAVGLMITDVCLVMLLCFIEDMRG